MHLSRNGKDVQILRLLQTQPMTEHELSVALGFDLRQTHSHLANLHCLRLIEPSGLRRKNPNGRSAIVWRPATTPPQPPLRRTDEG